MNPVEWYERAQGRTDRPAMARELSKMMLDAESPVVQAQLLDIADELGLKDDDDAKP